MTGGWVRRQVTIEYPTVTKDATTQAPVTAWTPLVSGDHSPDAGERFWALVRDVPPSRSETVRQGLQQWRQPSQVRIRWRDDVTSAMRVRLHGDGTDVLFRIVGGPADVEGRKRYIELVCERYGAEGDG
jgi:SPP1 family predicted phage head-tail adaptor